MMRFNVKKKDKKNGDETTTTTSSRDQSPQRIHSASSLSSTRATPSSPPPPEAFQAFRKKKKDDALFGNKKTTHSKSLLDDDSEEFSGEDLFGVPVVPKTKISNMRVGVGRMDEFDMSTSTLGMSSATSTSSTRIPPPTTSTTRKTSSHHNPLLPPLHNNHNKSNNRSMEKPKIVNKKSISNTWMSNMFSTDKLLLASRQMHFYRCSSVACMSLEHKTLYRSKSIAEAIFHHRALLELQVAACNSELQLNALWSRMDRATQQVALFQLMDRDQSGFIEQTELARLLHAMDPRASSTQCEAEAYRILKRIKKYIKKNNHPNHNKKMGAPPSARTILPPLDVDPSTQRPRMSFAHAKLFWKELQEALIPPPDEEDDLIPTSDGGYKKFLDVNAYMKKDDTSAARDAVMDAAMDASSFSGSGAGPRASTVSTNSMHSEGAFMMPQATDDLLGGKTVLHQDSVATNIGAKREERDWQAVSQLLLQWWAFQVDGRDVVIELLDGSNPNTGSTHIFNPNNQLITPMEWDQWKVELVEIRNALLFQMLDIQGMGAIPFMDTVQLWIEMECSMDKSTASSSSSLPMSVQQCLWAMEHDTTATMDYHTFGMLLLHMCFFYQYQYTNNNKSKNTCYDFHDLCNQMTLQVSRRMDIKYDMNESMIEDKMTPLVLMDPTYGRYGILGEKYKDVTALEWFRLDALFHYWVSISSSSSSPTSIPLKQLEDGLRSYLICQWKALDTIEEWLDVVVQQQEQSRECCLEREEFYDLLARFTKTWKMEMKELISFLVVWIRLSTPSNDDTNNNNNKNNDTILTEYKEWMKRRTLQQIHQERPIAATKFQAASTSQFVHYLSSNNNKKRTNNRSLQEQDSQQSIGRGTTTKLEKEKWTKTHMNWMTSGEHQNGGSSMSLLSKGST